MEGKQQIRGGMDGWGDTLQLTKLKRRSGLTGEWVECQNGWMMNAWLEGWMNGCVPALNPLGDTRAAS